MHWFPRKEPKSASYFLPDFFAPVPLITVSHPSASTRGITSSCSISVPPSFSSLFSSWIASRSPILPISITWGSIIRCIDIQNCCWEWRGKRPYLLHHHLRRHCLLRHPQPSLDFDSQLLNKQAPVRIKYDPERCIIEATYKSKNKKAKAINVSCSPAQRSNQQQ